MAMFRDDNADITDYSMDSIDTPQSRRVKNTVLVELRGSPRVEATLPVEIRPRSGGSVLAMITNISRTGLRAEGNSSLVDTLFDGEVRLQEHESVVALFRFTVPAEDDRDLEVEVHGRTVYARLDRGSYQVGVQFLEFSSGREALFDYLASRGVHH